MSNKTLSLTDELYQYMLSVSLREPEVLRKLREETATLPDANMQIAPEQGQFMSLLVRLANVRRAIEVGVFTGYSALCVARALPEDGQLICCDVNAATTGIARRYWREAGVDHKIRLELAPAAETLRRLRADAAASFDLVFIDADKESYVDYYEQSLALLRRGGLILVDNVLWSGKVADARVRDAATGALRDFNRLLHKDERIDLSLLPIADGVTLARKR